MEQLQCGNTAAPDRRRPADTACGPGYTILLTPLAEELIVDPAATVTVIAATAQLLRAGKRLQIVMPHHDTQLTQDDLPPSLVAFLADHRLGPPDLLPVSDEPEVAVCDVTAWIAQLAPPDAIYGPETHGLLYGIAALRHAGLAFRATEVSIIPFGVQSLLLARRCEFTSAPVSVDREFIECDLLRLADAVMVETRLQQAYVTRLVPQARCRLMQLPFPAWLDARVPAHQAPRPHSPDRLVFLGSLSSAGGLELLRGILQHFTRLRRRLHVTLAGCVGPSAFGDPFWFVAEALADLRHDIDFVLSHDPMTLLSALDGSALVVVADKLPLRTPMLAFCRARGLPVLDLICWDWIEDWHGDAGSLAQRYIPYRAGAARVLAALDGIQPDTELPPAQALPPDAPEELPVATFQPAAGQPGMAIVLCRDRAPAVERWPSVASANCHVLICSGDGFRLLGRDGTLGLSTGASVADVIAMLLDWLPHDCFAIFAEHAAPSAGFARGLPDYAGAAMRRGALLGKHGQPSVTARASSPPRHLLQPLWHPLWLAPNAIYARERLSAAAASTEAGRHRFSAFGLWCIDTATGSPALTVPVEMSHALQTTRCGWQSQTARRRNLDHVIELAAATGSLSRDLSAFIHGVHGAGKILSHNDLGGLMPAEDRASMHDLQRHFCGHSPGTLLRFARVVMALGRPDAALLLLDKVGQMTGLPDSPDIAALRAKLAAGVQLVQPATSSGPQADAAIKAATAAIDRRAAADAGAKLGGPQVSLISEVDVDPATIRTIVGGLLADYIATQRWDKFNVLAGIYVQQFGEDGIADRLRQNAAAQVWGPGS